MSRSDWAAWLIVNLLLIAAFDAIVCLTIGRHFLPFVIAGSALGFGTSLVIKMVGR